MATMKFVGAFLRSFWIQASWNLNRLQSTGWIVTIEPLLRLVPGGKHGRTYRDAMMRAGQYYNSHPFFANFAVGAVARAELKGVEPEQIERFRDAIKGPLGSVGDRLIWGGVLPVSSSLGLLTMIAVSPLAGVVVFLVLFNAVHVLIRAWGLRQGWRHGLGVSKPLHSRSLQGSIKLGEYATPFVYGLATPLLAEQLLNGFDVGARIAALAAAAMTVVCLRWLLPTIGAARLGAGAVIAALLIGALWA